MTGWTRIKWTEAAQVAEMSGRPLPAGSDWRQSPQAHVESLAAAGELAKAVQFLGVALPRLEAVAWAIEALGEVPGRGAAERAALAAVRRWREDPSDAHRRAAWEAAAAADTDAPERFAALAAFFSGGSIAPAELGAVQPPRHVCGTMAAGAIVAAAMRAPEPDGALAAALAIGSRIAAQGLA